MVSATARAEDIDPLALERGRDLYRHKCAACHKLREPSDYSGDKWQFWMEKMRQKAHLDDAQYADLLCYTGSLNRRAKAPAHAAIR